MKTDIVTTLFLAAMGILVFSLLMELIYLFATGQFINF